MKVTFPKNIKKGLLSGMTLSLGPVTVSVVQLFLLAVGVGLSLAVFSSLSKTAGNGIAIMVAIPVFVIFIIIAFFKISEMGLLEFIAKLVRNKFFDVQKKFQINFERNNDTEISIKEAKQGEEKKQVIEQKTEDTENSSELIDAIEKGDLL